MAKEWAADFYNGPAWRKCAKGYLASRNFLCERCAMKGIASHADIAHHKVYLTPQNIGDAEIALCWGNLEALCQACHNNEHKHKGRRIMYDEEGMVLPV